MSQQQQRKKTKVTAEFVGVNLIQRGEKEGEFMTSSLGLGEEAGVSSHSDDIDGR